MPKNLFILVMLSIGSFKMNAQKLVFDLNGRINFTQSDEYSKIDITEGYSSMSLNDSTEIRTYSEFIIYRTKEYMPKIGYDINGLFTFRLSDRFSLRTGIGLNYWSHRIGTTFDLDFGDVTRVDTVPKNMIVIFPGGSESCDCYENSFSDVRDKYDPNIHQEMIHLSMPADFGYDIIPGKLSVRAGLYFQTPLYAAAKREYVDVEKTTMNDTTKCKYVIRSEKNTASSGISNFQWGVSGWISYEILPKVQLEIGARQQMSDMYVKEEYQYFSNDNNSFKPLTFSAGLSYRLYNGTPEN